MIDKLMKAAKDYTENMTTCDLALLKFCLCAMGILLGIAVPKKHKAKVAIVSSGIFAVTYVVLIIPFLKLLDVGQEKKESDSSL